MMEKVDRKSGLGGTDISAIMGLNPYKGPWDVYALKRGLVEDVAGDNERAKWGKRLERLIAEAYGEITNQTVSWCDITKRRPERPWQIWTADAHVIDARVAGSPEPDVLPYVRGVDCKTAGLDQARHFGETGTDEVPDHYSIQAHWYMSAEDLPFWDIALLIAGNDFRIFTIERDKEIEATLLQEGERFWRECIEAENPPDIGASELAKEYLRKRFPRNVANIRQCTEEEATLVAAYAEVRSEFDEKKTLKEAMENQIKEAIGETDGILVPGGKVTWKLSKDSVHTDWELIARTVLRDLLHEDADALIRVATSTKPGSRRFHFGVK